MKLLEVVTTPATGRAAVDAAREFGASLGKTVVVVQDTPGFIVNRLMTPQILNAIRLVEAGVATIEDVDTGLKLGLNNPLGPLALADLIGLDTLLAMADTMYEKLHQEQYLAPEMLKSLVAAGKLGRKSGRGFYTYSKE
jgi:3-hydroxybutyryl-CoA dehydrogenase